MADPFLGFNCKVASFGDSTYLVNMDAMRKTIFDSLAMPSMIFNSDGDFVDRSIRAMSYANFDSKVAFYHSIIADQMDDFTLGRLRNSRRRTFSSRMIKRIKSILRDRCRETGIKSLRFK